MNSDTSPLARDPDLERLTDAHREQEDGIKIEWGDAITEEKLTAAFASLERSSATDDDTSSAYAAKAEENIRQLRERIKAGKYQTPESQFHTRPGESRKSILVGVLEDRIVQRTVVDYLKTIYDRELQTCSLGGCSTEWPQDALKQIKNILASPTMRWVLPLVVVSYRSDVVRKSLTEALGKLVNNDLLHQLLVRWVNLGIIDCGKIFKNEISPLSTQPVIALLADLHLHLTLERWFEQTAKPLLRGVACRVRFGGEAVLCFELQQDGEKVRRDVDSRFRQSGLILNTGKTRLLAYRNNTEDGTIEARPFFFLGTWFSAAPSQDQVAEGDPPVAPAMEKHDSDSLGDPARSHRLEQIPPLPAAIERVEIPGEPLVSTESSQAPIYTSGGATTAETDSSPERSTATEESLVEPIGEGPRVLPMPGRSQPGETLSRPSVPLPGSEFAPQGETVPLIPSDDAPHNSESTVNSAPSSKPATGEPASASNQPSFAGQPTPRPLPIWAMVRLENIDIHPSLPAKYCDEGLRFPPEWPDSFLTPKGIRTAAQYLPIHVIASECGKYLCFGSVRLLYAARQLLPPTEKLAVVLHDATSADEVLEGYEMESDILFIWHRQEKGDRENLDTKYITSPSPNGLRESLNLKEKKRWSKILQLSPGTLHNRISPPVKP